MRRTFVYLLHAGLWFSHIALVVLILAILFNGKEDTDKISLFWDRYFWVALVPSVLSFYLFYFFIFPVYVQKKRVALSIVVGVLICLFCSGITNFMIAGLNVNQSADNNTDILQSLLVVFFVALGNGIMALILCGFINWVREIRWKEDLMKRNHEMEMALVRAQLDPHFLFNTINNIDSLILKSPQVASDYLNGLADVMRFMFFFTRSDRIALEQEVEYLVKYIALQNLRTSASNYATLSVSGDTRGRSLAPMILMPFVENAFKHAPANGEEGTIRIDISVSDDQLTFTCTNQYDTSSSHVESYRIGNELIQKRLQLIYPDAHTLKIRNENNRYTVTLLVKA